MPYSVRWSPNLVILSSDAWSTATYLLSTCFKRSAKSYTLIIKAIQKVSFNRCYVLDKITSFILIRPCVCNFSVVIWLPRTENQAVHKNTFRHTRAFYGRIGIWKCWVLRRGENRSTRRKTSRSREENKQQTQATYDAGSGNRTRDTLVGKERSRYCVIPASPDRPIYR